MLAAMEWFLWLLYGRRPPIATSWTPADLEANRRERMSPAQRRVLAWSALRALAITAVFGAGTAVTFAWWSDIEAGTAERLAGVSIAFAIISLYRSVPAIASLVRVARGRVRILRGIHDLTRTPDDELERSVGGHFLAFPYDFSLKLNIEVIVYVVGSDIPLAIELV